MSEIRQTRTKWRLSSSPGQAEVLVRGVDGNTENIGAESRGVEAEIEAAYQRGSTEGAAAARRELEAEVLSLREQNRRLITAMPASVTGFLDRLQEQVLAETAELALALAGIILRSPVCHADAVRAAIAEALELLGNGHGDVRVCMHPLDAKALASASEAWPPSWKSVSDASIAPGDVRIETANAGQVNGMIATRLENVAVKLREQLNIPGPEEAG